MNWNLLDYLGVSRRDVGAGIAAGGSALFGIALFNWFIGEGFRPQGFIAASMFVYVSDFPVPILAVCVSTVVWRVMMPDESAPVRGALAGIVSAFGTLIVLGALQGVVSFWQYLSVDPLSDAVSAFFITIVTIALWGSVFTTPLIVPLGAIGGYGYEWYLAES